MASFPMLLMCRKTELAKRLSSMFPMKYWVGNNRDNVVLG